MSNMEFIGADDLLRKIEEMGKNVKKSEGKALKAGGEVLADAMRHNVPVSSIHHKHIKDDIKVSLKTKDGERYAGVGPSKETAWRAKFIEFGTSKMSSEPFMQPSLDQTKDDITTAIRNALKGEL